jgi:hypothetical protein
MKSYVYAYAIGTSHIKEKVNVFNDKNLPKSRKIFWIKKWLQISRWTVVLSGTIWNIMH